MNELLAFISTLIISFWGSLQLGLVNVQVINRTLTYGRKEGVKFAFGGSLPEFIYSFFAIKMVHLIESNKAMIGLLSKLVVAIFLGLALYYWFKKSTVKSTKPLTGTSFLGGFLLGMLNPQLIVFWTMVFFYLGRYLNLESGYLIHPHYAMMAGAMVGAFLCLNAFIAIAVKYKDALIARFGDRLNKITSLLFFILAFIEIIRLL